MCQGTRGIVALERLFVMKTPKLYSHDRRRAPGDSANLRWVMYLHFLRDNPGYQALGHAISGMAMHKEAPRNLPI
jgi:hypothetical protein